MHNPLSAPEFLPSFPVMQASSLDRKIIGKFEIPAGSFGIFTIIALILWIALYDQVFIPIASRIKGNLFTSLQKKIKKGIGIFVSFFTMVATAAVETIRRSHALKEGVSDDLHAIVHMSALWIVPQYCLLGFTEGLNVIAQNKFFISELSRSMSSMASNLCGVGLSVASLLARFIMTPLMISQKEESRRVGFLAIATRVIMIAIIGFLPV